MNKKLIIYRIITGCLVIFMMALIFSFSSQNGASSGGLSEKITWSITQIIFPNWADFPIAKQEAIFSNLHHFIRKLAHFSIYFLLGLFSILHLLSYSIKTLYKGISSILFSLIYACSDEFHQGFVDGRGPSFIDVLIDTSGAILAILITLLIYYLIKKRKNAN